MLIHSTMSYRSTSFMPFGTNSARTAAASSGFVSRLLSLRLGLLAAAAASVRKGSRKGELGGGGAEGASGESGRWCCETGVLIVRGPVPREGKEAGEHFGR